MEGATFIALHYYGDTHQRSKVGEDALPCCLLINANQEPAQHFILISRLHPSLELKARLYPVSLPDSSPTCCGWLGDEREGGVEPEDKAFSCAI